MGLVDAPRLGDHERKIKEEDLICLEHARGRTLGQKWTLKTRLSRGSFGPVYIAQRLKNKKFASSSKSRGKLCESIFGMNTK